MSALSSFLGGAVIGAGDAYTKLADEQRAFRIDQTKQDALYARMLNLKRAEKGMEKSGVLDESGLPMTNDEVDQYGEDRSALKGPITAAAEMQKIKEADQPSQYMRNGVVLTKGEVAELQGDFSGVVPVYTQRRQDEQSDRIDAQEVSDANYERRRRDQVADDDKRVKASEERAAKTFKNQWDLVEHKDFETSYEIMRKDIKKNASIVEKEAKDGAYPSITGNKTKDVRIYRDEVVIDTMAGWSEGLPREDLMRANERDPNFFNIIAMPEILLTGTVGKGSDAVPLAGKNVEEVKEVMKTKGIDEYTINRFIDYATVKGHMEYNKGSKRKGTKPTWVFKSPVSDEE